MRAMLRLGRVGFCLLVVLGAGVPLTLQAGSAGADVPPVIAYVASGDTTAVFGNGSVRPINLTTNTVGIPILVAGCCPQEIAITPDGKTAYVTAVDLFGSSPGSVTPINLTTNTAGTPIPVGSTGGIAITPDGATAYVSTSDGFTHAGSVKPISVATNTAGTPIPVSGSPGGIAITPDGKTAYVVNSMIFGGSVTPIDVATNTARSPLSVGDGASKIAITPDGETLYVSNGDSGRQTGNTVTSINLVTRTLASIPVGHNPVGIAITPDGKTAYVVNARDGSVTPINVATNTPGSPIPVGSLPRGIAITPDGKTVYVINQGDGSLTPINVATNTAGNSILLGGSLTGIAIMPALAPPPDETPPVVTVPADITADASTPKGVVVSYAASATDDVDGNTPVTCMPASGSTFPIGTTLVTCSATDSSGNSNSRTFLVHVEGATEQLADLGKTVTGVGPGSSLADKVKQVQAYLANDQSDACSTLNAFIRQVEAQTGKTIEPGTTLPSQAALLIASAERIENVIGC